MWEVLGEERGKGRWRYRFCLESPAVADGCNEVYGHEIPNAAETCVFNWEGGQVRICESSGLVAGLTRCSSPVAVEKFSYGS